jgi:hypothetical protein
VVVVQDPAAGLAEAGGVLAGEHGDDAGGPARAGEIEGGQTGVGVEATHEGNVHHAGEQQIVDVAAAAGEESWIVRARRRRADVCHSAIGLYHD